MTVYTILISLLKASVNLLHFKSYHLQDRHKLYNTLFASNEVKIITANYNTIKKVVPAAQASQHDNL